MYVLLTYDVEVAVVDRVKRACRRQLNHVQYSVFEGDITEAGYRRLTEKLKSIIGEKGTVRVYRFRTERDFQLDELGVHKQVTGQFL